MRRAKAAALLGKTTVRARIADPDSGLLGPVVEVELSELRSPYKSSIVLVTVAGWQHWQEIMDEVATDSYSPILIEVGDKGMRLQDVEVT